MMGRTSKEQTIHRHLIPVGISFGTSRDRPTTTASERLPDRKGIFHLCAHARATAADRRPSAGGTSSSPSSHAIEVSTIERDCGRDARTGCTRSESPSAPRSSIGKTDKRTRAQRMRRRRRRRRRRRQARGDQTD